MKTRSSERRTDSGEAREFIGIIRENSRVSARGRVGQDSTDARRLDWTRDWRMLERGSLRETPVAGETVETYT